MKRKFLILSLLMLGYVLSNAQFNLTGRVIDKSTNKTLPGANYSIAGYKGSTNSDGVFVIKNLKRGTYTILFSFVGYKKFEDTIVINSDTKRDFLMDLDIILQEEVIINATRANNNSASTYKTIEKSEIKKFNIGQDLPYILQNTPSVVVTSDAGTGVGYTGMRIRGTDATRINFTVNGIPLNDAESNGMFFVDLPDFAASLNSVQIQRGVGTSTNGASAFGASVNMLTGNISDKPELEIAANYGSFNTQVYRIAGTTGILKNKWSFDGRLSSVTSDGFIDRATSKLYSAYGSASYYGKRSILRFNIYTGYEKTYQAWNGIPKVRLNSDKAGMQEYLDNWLYTEEEYQNMLNSNPRTYNYCTYKNETDNYNQTHAQLHYSKELNSHLTFNTALHYTKGKGYYENYKYGKDFFDYGVNNPIVGSDTISTSDFIQQKWLDNQFYGLTFNTLYDNKSKVKAIFGGALNQYNGDHFGILTWSKVKFSDSDYEWYRGNGLKTDFNIFGKINYQLTGLINIYGDLQYRKIEYKLSGIEDDLHSTIGAYNYDFINPKIGFTYSISENEYFYSSIAVSNKEPNRDNFTDADAGNIPKSENLKDFELGYNFQNSSVSFQMNYFHMNYHNQLVETGKVNNVGAPVLINVDKSYRQGIEISSNYRFSSALRWIVNLSLSENKINNFTEYVDNWDTGLQDSKNLGKTDISFSPSMIANNIFIINYKKLPTIYLISRFVSRQYIDNTSNIGRSIDPYFVSDLKISQKLKIGKIKNLEINFSVNNIFNTEYESFAWVYRYKTGGQEYEMDGYFPQAGVNFNAGVSLKF